MAPDAADGQELRPPSLDRRRNAAGSQEQAAASRVMLPASSIPQTAAWRVNRPAYSVWLDSGFEVGADWQRTSRPSVAMPPARLDDQASEDIRHACTRFRCETGQDDHPAQRPVALRGAGFEVGVARPFIQVELGAGTDQAYWRSDPPGCRRNRAYIIPATPDAHPPSCGLRLG